MDMRIMDPAPRLALYFWRDAYRSGTRITWTGDTFAFQQVDGVAGRRTELAKGFGIFGDLPTVQPQPWILEGCEQHSGELIAWLDQKPPKRYAHLFCHLLVGSCEMDKLESVAWANGYDIRGQGLDGGYFALYRGKCTANTKMKVPTMPPVIAHYRELAI